MTTRKTAPKPAAVVEAEKRSSIPKRPVIQHTALFRAALQVEQSAKTDALAGVDRDLAHAAGVRDEEQEAAKRAYNMALDLAAQKFMAIRAGLDAERSDIIQSLQGIDAALAALGEPVSEPANVVPMAAE